MVSAPPKSETDSPVFKESVIETEPFFSTTSKRRRFARLTNLNVQPLSVQYFNRIDFIYKRNNNQNYITAKSIIVKNPAKHRFWTK